MRKRINKTISGIVVFVLIIFLFDYGYQFIQLVNNSAYTTGSGCRVRTKGRMKHFLYQYEVEGKKYISPRTFVDSLNVGEEYAVLYCISDPCISILLDSSCVNSEIDYSDILHHLSKKTLMGHIFDCN